MDAIGLRFQLDHVSTNFVYLFALMDTNVINEEERLYLPLLMHCLLESAVERDGVVIPYDEVVLKPKLIKILLHLESITPWIIQLGSYHLIGLRTM